MRTAGLQLDPHLCETIMPFEHIVLQFGIFPLGIDFDHIGLMIFQEMIGEDFAVYTEYAPCVFAHLGCDGGYPLHSNYVNFKEEAMATGIAAEVRFVLDGLAALNHLDRV